MEAPDRPPVKRLAGEDPGATDASAGFLGQQAVDIAPGPRRDTARKLNLGKLIEGGTGNMAELRLMIDGEEIILEANGKSKRGTYEKYMEPSDIARGTDEVAPLIVTVYLRPGWTPSQSG